MTLSLVYQCGIANVFRSSPSRPVRLLQAGLRTCEDFCRGAKAAGAAVQIFHCDQAGDVAALEWTPGKGDLWEAEKAQTI